MSANSNTSFPDVPEYYPDHPNLLRQIIRVVKNIMQGRTNNTYSCTLTPNAVSTVVSVAKGDIGQNSLVVFVPTTVSAATEFGAGKLYVSARDILADPPTFTITHANTADTDKTFSFILIG